MSLGSIFAFSMIPLKTTDNKTSGGVSLNRPFFAFVSGVLKAAQITTSS
jgi:hypothetical protein